MAAKVLIIDDEDVFREDLAILLRRRNCECLTASNGEEGLDILNSFEPDVILCDIIMPGRGGIELLDDFSRCSPKTSVIMITAFGSLQTAINAFRKGAADYVMKPLVIEDVVQKIDRLMTYKRLSQEVKSLRRELSQDVASLSVVSQSQAMKDVLEQVGMVAPTRSTVLITGESGTGKELIARAIHSMSVAREEASEVNVDDLPFVPINCAGIPAELLESQLFGHLRGAFTGAVENRVGQFELARDGTILLDEVAEMPMALQSKLLRVLEEREFVPVGSSTSVPLLARIVTATNKNLRTLVEKDEFREDLLFRLAVFEIPLPPLRQRRSDISPLLESFIRKFNKEMKRCCQGVDRAAMRQLLAHSWPGNVRELRNVVERAMILNRGEYIRVEDLPHELQDSALATSSTDDLREAMRSYEAAHILHVLDATGWNREETSRCLGINPSTLYRKMTDLSLHDSRRPTSRPD